jgi:hypothetical protein
VTDGPSVEADLWQYYRGRSPGQIEVLAPDLFDGTAAQLTQFKNETGATFPLLLNGAAGAGNENLFTVYGDRDNYAVVSKQGIVRYNAFNFWPYGARYHLDELRGCIDSLLTVTTDVDGGNAPHAFGLVARPNPARGAIVLELANPSEQALTAGRDLRPGGPPGGGGVRRPRAARPDAHDVDRPRRRRAAGRPRRLPRARAHRRRRAHPAGAAPALTPPLARPGSRRQFGAGDVDYGLRAPIRGRE